MRLGAAEAVNALLGVAYQEHAGRFARAGVARQPCVQCLPLQRVGVLKFVNQQMAHPCIQALLHPTAEHVVGQQGERGTLQIAHIQPAAIALELCVSSYQKASKARHALVVLVGFVLGLCGQILQCAVLRGTHGVYATELVAELARCAGFGQQSGRYRFRAPAGQGQLQLAGGAEAGFQRAGSQGAGSILQQGLVDWCAQAVVWRCAIRHVGELLHKGLNRVVHHAVCVGQSKLYPLVQRGFQRLLAVKAAMRCDQVHVVLPRLRLCHDPTLKTRPDQCNGFGIAFQQLVIGGQPHVGQSLHGRTAHQSRKPTVKGAYLHRPAAHQQRVVQATQLLQLFGTWLALHAPVQQFLAQLGIVHAGELQQPFLQARTHLARRFFGKSYRQNFVRGTSVQQRPHHARNQHPGLARARTRLHRYAAARIASNGVEAAALDQLAVVLKGGGGG